MTQRRDSGLKGDVPLYAFTGASGHLGRLVLKELLDIVPAGQILVITRKPEQLIDSVPQGVIVRRADFNDPSTLPPAFSGTTRLLIISTGDYKEIYSGQRIVQHLAAISAAIDAGVRHITYTSCPNATDTEIEDPLIRDHGQTEAALMDSGVKWTALRNNVYMAGLPYFLRAFFVSIILLYRRALARLVGLRMKIAREPLLLS
jgi:NAD(P)H dehydrogenase (quinone)